MDRCRKRRCTFREELLAVHWRPCRIALLGGKEIRAQTLGKREPNTRLVAVQKHGRVLEGYRHGQGSLRCCPRFSALCLRLEQMTILDNDASEPDEVRRMVEHPALRA